MATERGYFVFCFHDRENEELWDEQNSPNQVYVQIVATEVWVFEESGGPEDFAGRLFDGIHTVDELKTAFHRMLVEEGGLPEEVVYIPFEKLDALMAAGGWRFVNGSYSFGEGFDDIDIRVVLER